jgi:hypothetical protein
MIAGLSYFRVSLFTKQSLLLQNRVITNVNLSSGTMGFSIVPDGRPVELAAVKRCAALYN